MAAIIKTYREKSRIRKILDYVALTIALTLFGLTVTFVVYNVTAGNL